MQKLTHVLAAAITAAAMLTGAAKAEPLGQKIEATRVVDLTQLMYPGMPYWPGGIPFEMTRVVDYDQGYRLHKFAMGENTGTHVDSPAHFIEGNLSIDKLALSNLIVPAVVIDVRDKVAGNADYELGLEDIKLWEAENGKIPAGSLVLLNTGWSKRSNSIEKYRNMDANDVMHFPGFHPAATELLLERDVAGIGIDTLSLDYGPSTTFATHVAMLKANKYQIENMANLDALPATGATVIVASLLIRDATQAQARVLALLP